MNKIRGGKSMIQNLVICIKCKLTVEQHQKGKVLLNTIFNKFINF